MHLDNCKSVLYDSMSQKMHLTFHVQIKNPIHKLNLCLSPSGHEFSWMNVCVASDMQTCAMCAEQCLNAHVAHVCNAPCADVCVCAPLCTCSAIVRTLWIQIATCFFKVQGHFEKLELIHWILKKSKFPVDFETIQNTSYEMNGDINCAWSNRACGEFEP